VQDCVFDLSFGSFRKDCDPQRWSSTLFLYSGGPKCYPKNNRESYKPPNYAKNYKNVDTNFSAQVNQRAGTG
jgi:hypothetical protein